METQEKINAMQSRQLELLAVMSRSDAHAAKCAKLGVKFSDEYPDELKEYESANTEYNANEAEIAILKTQAKSEEIEASNPLNNEEYGTNN